MNSQPAGVTTPGAPELTEVAAGVYAYLQPDGSWYLNNTGFIVGDRSVISIDACSTQARTQRYLDTIATVTHAPVTTLVNTHHHGDHTYGNCVISDAAPGDLTIIGQDRCRELVIATGLPGNTGIWTPVDWGELRVEPPNLTFADRLRLWSGDRLVELSYVGQPAHTTNDSLVWLPAERVLFCGDLLFNGGTPFLLMGSVTGAIEVLRTVVRPIPAATIVPGHGDPCGPELIDTVLGYLDFVLALARDGLAAGLPPLAVAREADLGEYAQWLDSERIVGNLHRAYSDLDPGREAPQVITALTDMVAYNGGQPLTCRA